MKTLKEIRHEAKKVRAERDGSTVATPETVDGRARYRVHRLDGCVEHRRLLGAAEVVLMSGGLCFFRVDLPGDIVEYVEAANPKQARELFEAYRSGRIAHAKGAW